MNEGCNECRFDSMLGCTYHKPCDAESAPPIPGCPSKKTKIDKECYTVCKGPRSCIAEEATPILTGATAECELPDKSKCRCWPTEHAGRGACGKVLTNPFSPVKNPASDFVGS